MLAATLSGCGMAGAGGEDFSVAIDRPVEKVLASFGEVDTSEGALVFPGMKIDRSKPSDREILYTIPASKGTPATIRLSFENVREGKGTVIHASIDVPPVIARIDGGPKVVSEDKVEAEIEKILKRAKTSMEQGGTSGGAMTELSALLVGVSIAINSDYLEKALALKNNPEQLADLIDATADDSAYEDAEEARRTDDWGNSEPQHEEFAASHDEPADDWGNTERR